METEEITVESMEDLVKLIDDIPDGVILDIDMGKEDSYGDEHYEGRHSES